MRRINPLHRSIFAVYVAGIKCISDIQHFHQDGTIDTIFYGHQMFSDHPVWCCIDILLDIAAVLGAALITRDAIAARRRRTSE